MQATEADPAARSTVDSQKCWRCQHKPYSLGLMSETTRRTEAATAAISPETYEKLRLMAYQERKSRSALVREMIEDGVRDYYREDQQDEEVNQNA